MAGRLIILVFSAFLGAVIGGMVGASTGWLAWPEPAPEPEVFPYPHHVPKFPGAVTLRLAMVHDVLHERFPRHGRAYYVERNRRVREALPKAEANSPKYFALVDDLGVGLDQVGEHSEAIRVFRDKLAKQEKFGLKGRDLYSTYANLGTFLILGPFRKVTPGDPAAKEALREGLGYIKQSIAVNLQAHFGREVWQAVIVEYMAASLDNPRVLLEYDMVGDRLTRAVDPRGLRVADDSTDWMTRRGAKAYLQNPTSAEEAEEYRRHITRVGAEEGWNAAVPSSHTQPVPFDEPCLGIIGMWRLGGGAHPYFSLALSEMMLRVGQRYIAWCGYERTIRLAGFYWPDPAIQDKLKEHCRARQAMLEAQLPEPAAQMRSRFDAELEHGLAYQRAYQQYEEQRIAAGASIDDPHFYDDFHKEHKPIASPVGPADQYVTARTSYASPRLSWPLILLGAGAHALATALVFRSTTPRV